MSLTLKEFKVTPTERGTGLTCPRKDCGSKFIVNYGEVLKRKLEHRNRAGHIVPIKTITCPCCSRVSAIPADDLAEQGHTPCRHTKQGKELYDA